MLSETAYLVQTVVVVAILVVMPLPAVAQVKRTHLAVLLGVKIPQIRFCAIMGVRLMPLKQSAPCLPW